ncbi:MAG: hypothetical protein U1E83_08885 [Methylotetracoccus sp.]
MTLFLISFGVFALVFLLMAVGVLFGARRSGFVRWGQRGELHLYD